MAGKPDLVLIPAWVPDTRHRLSLFIPSLNYTASSRSEAAQLMFEQSLFLSGKKAHWINHSYIQATLVYKPLLENNMDMQKLYFIIDYFISKSRWPFILKTLSEQKPLLINPFYKLRSNTRRAAFRRGPTVHDNCQRA